MRTWAVILAAGSGSRLREHTRVAKQFLLYGGVPLFWHSARVFCRMPGIEGLVFVFPRDVEHGADDGAALLNMMLEREPLAVPWKIARGGARRQDSVAAGLALLPPGCEAVLVHDGARPFVSAALATRVLAALGPDRPAVVPGYAVTDTIKTVDHEGRVRATPERALLRAVQTPQGFLLEPLQKAHERARLEGFEATDDAALLERCAMPVFVVEGDMDNVKITAPQDLERLADKQEPGYAPCTGFGYDVHRYGGERSFILGGVPIACDIRVAAHSDGDVLLHALMDALLGCAGLGDIGGLFPDSDPAYENIASGILLAEVLERVRTAGILITHVDLTVIAQAPRVAPHRAAIAANVAKMLAMPLSAVNVKATTEERLGFTGEKKGIKAVAVVSALKPCESACGGARLVRGAGHGL